MEAFKEVMKRNWVEVVYTIAAVLMTGYAFEATTGCLTDVLGCLG